MTNTGGHMWKLCLVTGANIQTMLTILFYIYALTRPVFAAGDIIKQRNVCTVG